MIEQISTSVLGDIEDLALDLGAVVVRTDGSVFNVAGRANTKRLPKPKRGEAQPEPPPTSRIDELLAKVVELVAAQAAREPVTLSIPEIPAPVVPAPTVVVQPAPKTAWEFEFERNKDGTIKKIKATPVST